MKLSPHRVLALIAGALALGASYQTALAQQAQPCTDPASTSCAAPNLFTTTGPAGSTGTAEREAYQITPAFDALRGGANAAASNSIDLSLPGQGAHVAVLERARANNWNGLTAQGHNAVIDSDGRQMYAHLFTGGDWWVIRPERGGHRLARIDNGAIRPDAQPIRVTSAMQSASTTTKQLSLTTAAAASTTTSVATIDVLFVFTREAALAVGDSAALDLFAAHAMSLQNTVFQNSQVTGVEFRSVASAVAERSDGNTVDQDLAWAKDDPTINALRDDAGADVVVLIGDYGGAVCGIAYEQSYPGPGFAPFAFAVADRASTENGLALQHEIGHLLGMQHDPDDANSSSPPAYAYGYGHLNLPDDTHTLGFLTVMSYQGACGGSPPCYQVPYYSNASITLDSDPIQGRALGIADQRENYRIAQATAPIVAAFRDPKPPLLSDNFE